LKERIKNLRNALGYTQQEFADKLGLKRNSVASYEIGKNIPMDTVIFSICREFKVNEDWLRYGTGEMFKNIPEEDEVAAYVSDLLEDDGSNAVYTLIKEIMHTYNELDTKSQEVLKMSCGKLIENLSKKREG
jgi:transcriptional regulator with XRE-family HTH domain